MTRSLYKGNVLKSNMVVVQDEDMLLIDNNEKIARKIEDLQELMVNGGEVAYGDGEGAIDGFMGGLDAEQVDALVADLDLEQDFSNVIKAERPPEPEAQQNTADALAVVSAQAQEMLEAARREAESIKSSAMMEAQQELEERRSQIYAEAQSQGYEAGYQEAMGQAEQMKAQLQEDRKRMEAEYQELVEGLEPRFVEALTDIYEKVFQVDLKKEQNIIMHLISSTMHKIEGSNTYLIHVSKEDYPYVNMKKQEVLAASVSPHASVEIVEDITLGANDCIIETDGGVFDCGLGTQLEELSQKLRLLSYTGN